MNYGVPLATAALCDCLTLTLGEGGNASNISLSAFSALSFSFRPPPNIPGNVIAVILNFRDARLGLELAVFGRSGTDAVVVVVVVVVVRSGESVVDARFKVAVDGWSGVCVVAAVVVVGDEGELIPCETLRACVRECGTGVTGTNGVVVKGDRGGLTIWEDLRDRECGMGTGGTGGMAETGT